MNNGVSSPYVKITTASGYNIHERVTYFRYRDSEKADDYSIIKFEFDDPLFPDISDLQENKVLRVEFGELGEESKARTIKLYIRDTSVKYDVTEQVLEIRCTDKYSYAKQDKKTRTHTGTAEEITQKIAEENNLKFVLEKDPKLTYNTKHKFDVKAIPGQEDLVPFNYTKPEWEDYLKGNNTLVKPQKTVELAANSGRRYVGDPQANISDARYLKELWGREEGNTEVTGKGDNLVVRQKNYNQKPLREYTWRGGDGFLISFSPETKNRMPSTTAMYQNTLRFWDKDTKSYKELKVSAGDNPQTRLGDSIPGSKEYRDKMDNEAEKIKRQTGKDPRIVTTGVLPFYTDYEAGSRQKAQRDNTIVFQGGFTYTSENRSYYGDDQEYTPEETVSKELSGIDNEELESSPAVAKVVGETMLASGKLVTISNIAAKFAGNYYIETAEHEIIPNQAYYCTLHFARNGRNSVGDGDPSLIPHEFKINKIIGDVRDNSDTITI